MESIFKNISKVGIVVEDIISTIKNYNYKFGIGPWKIWEFNSHTIKEIPELGDKNIDYNLLVAQSHIGNTIWELIEPKDKNSIFYQFLKTHGEDVFNIGYTVNDFNDSMNFFKKSNIEIKYGGNWSGKKFAYIDTYKDLKHIAEIYGFDTGFTEPEPIDIFPHANSKNKDEKKDLKPIFKSVRQVGIAVKDIKKVAQTYYDKYGIGPWEFYKYFYPKTKEMYYGTEELFTQKFTTAAAMIGDIEQELMEPEDNYNVYSEFIGKYGEGLQHISFIYNLNFEEALEFHRKLGHKIKQSGNINGAIYAYIYSQDDLKIISEALYVPPNFEMPKSDYKYPDI